MPIFNFLLSGHRRHARLADAFVDGELGGGDLSRFETHLAECPKCQAAVSEARVLKATVAALPEFAAPRTFQLTPAMVAAPGAMKPRPSGTPLYLGFARAGAALAVGAFATVIAVGAFDSDGQQSADFDAGGQREIMMSGAPAQDTAGTDDASGNAGANTAPEAAPTATPEPQLPQSTSGGVSGAGAETPMVPSPQPPMTGADTGATPAADANRSSESNTQIAAGNGAAIEPVPGVTSFEPLSVPPAEDDGLSPWTVALGVLAAASLGTLALLEISRRRNGAVNQ